MGSVLILDFHSMSVITLIIVLGSGVIRKKAEPGRRMVCKERKDRPWLCVRI